VPFDGFGGGVFVEGLAEVAEALDGGYVEAVDG